MINGSTNIALGVERGSLGSWAGQTLAAVIMDMTIWRNENRLQLMGFDW